MKTLLLSTMFMFVFFTNSSQTAMAQPNTLTLDFDSKTPSHIALKNGTCNVKARVAYVTSTTNQPQSGWTVTFVLHSGPGPVPSSGVSDAKGLVRRKITWKTEIQAFVNNTQQNVLLQSDRIKCPDGSKSQ